MNIIIMMGPPGSGKGTYSKKLAEKYGYTHISMGEMLRNRAAIDDERGREVKSYMDRNVLLPERLVAPVLKETLAKVPPTATVILDGYPRTEEQRAALDRMIAEGGYTLQAAVALEAPEQVLIDRILGRGRNDIDRDEKKILKRMFDYRAQTVPVIAHYDAAGCLKRVESKGSIEDSVARVERALGLDAAKPAQKPDFKP
ncbi:MAG: adenylate kinase [Chloroflexi bacterium]|nr:adenylate kinase [Chloroflexota bacterium]